MTEEKWKDIEGYEGLYQVSSLGRVKSLDRIVPTKIGSTQTYYGSIKKNSISTTGYWRVNLHKDGKLKTYKVHNLMAVAFLSYKKDGLKYVVDHIDNNPLNNDLSNLQIITNRENTSKDRKIGSSKYTGVCFQSNKWVAQLQINRIDVYLGRFSDEIMASEVYKLAVLHKDMFDGDAKKFRDYIKNNKRENQC